jgi:hypothetical protein
LPDVKPPDAKPPDVKPADAKPPDVKPAVRRQSTGLLDIKTKADHREPYPVE